MVFSNQLPIPFKQCSSAYHQAGSIGDSSNKRHRLMIRWRQQFRNWRPYLASPLNSVEQICGPVVRVTTLRKLWTFSKCYKKWTTVCVFKNSPDKQRGQFFVRCCPKLDFLPPVWIFFKILKKMIYFLGLGRSKSMSLMPPNSPN